MKKVKYSEIDQHTDDIYVHAELKVTDRKTSGYIYYVMCKGDMTLIGDELDADGVRCLIRCLTAALKATGEWREEDDAER